MDCIDCGHVLELVRPAAGSGFRQVCFCAFLDFSGAHPTDQIEAFFVYWKICKMWWTSRFARACCLILLRQLLSGCDIVMMQLMKRLFGVSVFWEKRKTSISQSLNSCIQQNYVHCNSVLLISRPQIHVPLPHSLKPGLNTCMLKYSVCPGFISVPLIPGTAWAYQTHFTLGHLFVLFCALFMIQQRILRLKSLHCWAIQMLSILGARGFSCAVSG